MNGDGKDRPIGTVRFHPGDGVAVVGDRVVVLVLDAPTSALVQGLRSRLVGPVGADVALDAMVRAGGLDLPPFGLVAFEGSRARVVVRGSVRALVEASDDQFEVGGELVSTWVERVADGVQSVELTIAGAADRSGSGFEVDGGIVPAETVVVVAPVGSASSDPVATADSADSSSDESADEPPAVDAVHGDPFPASSDQPRTEGANEDDQVDERHAETPAEQHAETPVEHAAELPTEHASGPLVHDGLDPTIYVSVEGDAADIDAADGQTTGEAPDGHAEQDDAEIGDLGSSLTSDVEDVSSPESSMPFDLPVPPHFGGSSSLPEPPVEVDHGATLIGPFDDLGHAETPGSVAPAADGSDGSRVDESREPVHHSGPVISGTDAAEPAADDYDHLFGATQFRTVEQAAVRVDEEQSVPTDGLISQLPNSIDPAISSLDSSGGDVGGDHDGHTVSLASLRAQMQKPAPVAGNSPSVHAVHCPLGHLNPTHAGACRVCGAAIDEQEHVSVPRPVLGTLKFADGRVVSVTRPLVIGRSPAAEGQLSGEPPELVVVTSPLKEVSSTHLEVRLEGWQVLVVDRQSTNGTVITPPGRDPQRLRPDEAVPITPGTTVNLADEVEFVFEASQ